MKDQTELIKKIHSSGYRFVTVSSGGGTDAISALLRVPGASKSVLEAYVPYARESLDYYLLKKPDKYCSEDTTLSIAAKAFSAAKKIDPKMHPSKILGVGITASLATDYLKKGDHKFFIAIQTHAYSRSFSYQFKKGALSRSKEEEVVTDHIIKSIASSCKIETNLFETEYLKITTTENKKNWIKLVDNKIDFDASS